MAGAVELTARGAETVGCCSDTLAGEVGCRAPAGAGAEVAVGATDTAVRREASPSSIAHAGNTNNTRPTTQR